MNEAGKSRMSLGIVFHKCDAQHEKTDCPKTLFLNGIRQSPLDSALVNLFEFIFINSLEVELVHGESCKLR